MSGVVIRIGEPTADETFRALGTDVRLIVTGHDARRAVARARGHVLAYHRRLSRFLPHSEICRLNGDPRKAVPASALLRSAVRAGVWAARRSNGIVDPCLLDELEAVGYTRTYEPGDQPALRRLPPHAAAADHRLRWTQVRVDDDARTITRPPGLRLDLGGTGKGHVADLIAERFAPFGDWVVDCGGDIRVGGRHSIEVAHPLRDEPAARVTIRNGAIATSSVVSRAWTTGHGQPAHHLLDPRTGRPVWTGLLTATALATTTLEAETLAKMALLSGAPEARALLAPRGGVLVHEDGTVETVGPLEAAA